MHFGKSISQMYQRELSSAQFVQSETNSAYDFFQKYEIQNLFFIMIRPDLFFIVNCMIPKLFISRYFRFLIVFIVNRPTRLIIHNLFLQCDIFLFINHDSFLHCNWSAMIHSSSVIDQRHPNSLITWIQFRYERHPLWNVVPTLHIWWWGL